MSLDLPRERWAHLESRGVSIDFPFFLAPMVGLSHAALRETLRRYTPPSVSTLRFTEMLSSRRLPAERMGAKPETMTLPGERFLVPASIWPDYDCKEHGGAGWEVQRSVPEAEHACDLCSLCGLLH